MDQYTTLAPLAASYLFAGFTVLMFGINEFSKPTQPSAGSDAKNVIAQAMPSELTSEKDFLVAWVIYVFGLVFVFAMLSIAAAKVLPDLVPDWSKKNLSDEILPILVAFCLVGFMPNMPMLKQLEQWWREFMHRRASIPTAVLAVVEELNGREFVFEALPTRICQATASFTR